MLLFLFLLLVPNSRPEEAPLVDLPLGQVLGYTKTSYNGRHYLAFEGIPYAKAKRFAEPEPVDPWNGIWNATEPTTCAQTIWFTPGSKIGQEDCLHVNVYVPREEINPEEKLEVVVHIHGGSFAALSGATYCNPQFVMDKNVVFVSFNYRLGIFGFMSTEDEVVPGNNGLKDQVEALKWIRKNIASFGGNPDSVTLTGLSAGSISVHLHYLSTVSKGLFHRGFAQSGLALNSAALVEGNLDKVKQLADSLQCFFESTQEMVDCLKTSSFEDILEKESQLFYKSYVPVISFGPVVEKGGPNPFLAENPYNLLRKGQIQDLPFITSNTLHEGLLVAEYLTGDEYANLDRNWDSVAPVLFDFNYTLPEEAWVNVSDQIRRHYFGNQEITPEMSPKLIQALSDRYFLYDAEISIRMQANVTNSPVYYYIFAYPGDNNPAQTIEHGAEIRYMYGDINSSIQLTENELKVKDLLWDMIISYAKTGVPSFGGVEWEPTTFQEDVFLYILGSANEDIESATAEELGERRFWESLGFLENANIVDRPKIV